jgi:transcription-repair coupling factor (superfamily II helicase)
MALLAAPLPGECSRAGPFHGSSDALAIAELAGKVRPLLVITADATAAQRLKSEVAYFALALKTCVFPDWETLPYDQFSPHHDLVSERLATLYEMMRSTFDVAIVPVTTALTRLMPVEYLAANTF